MGLTVQVDQLVWGGSLPCVGINAVRLVVLTNRMCSGTLSEIGRWCKVVWALLTGCCIRGIPQKQLYFIYIVIHDRKKNRNLYLRIRNHFWPANLGKTSGIMHWCSHINVNYLSSCYFYCLK